MKTHRCEGSVVECCKIEFLKLKHWDDESQSEWLLYHAEYGKPKMSRVIGIKYCPFCGEKLEVK